MPTFYPAFHASVLRESDSSHTRLSIELVLADVSGTSNE